jgi:hypothetical protein
MAGIFANLVRSDDLIAILDRSDRVIASSDEQRLSVGTSLAGNRETKLSRLHHGTDMFLARKCRTKGYQGYKGLSWQGQVMKPLASAFQSGEQDREESAGVRQAGAEFISIELRNIRSSAARVTDDLSLIVLNGQIVAAKRDAREFMPVLKEIHTIGSRTREVFDSSIRRLYATVMESLMSEVRFQAFLAVDIMDRNLYERANDVRWWALTSRFRELLALPEHTQEQAHALTETLAYINGLYTVYTNLILFNTDRVVVAVSDPGAQHLVGTLLPADGGYNEALRVSDSQQYRVSPFLRTVLYANRPTYVYMTSVRSTQGERVIGGIAIVFDSEPQFATMLEDALPRDEAGRIVDGCFAVFADRHGAVISATGHDLRPGDRIDMASELLSLDNGLRRSALVQYGGRNYMVGVAVSQGYREYKTTNDYDNDVVALVFVPV